jgi:hypothetical protein
MSLPAVASSIEIAMPEPKSLLDFVREMRSGDTWLVVMLAIAFGDLYCIVHFERSLVALLSLDPSRLVGWLGPRWHAEAAQLLATAVAVWFYLLPLVLVPFWRWLNYLFWVHRPEWLQGKELPKLRDGWKYLPSARRQAIRENNPLLLAACEERLAVDRARTFRLSCVLGALLFALTAAACSTESSGTILLGAALTWFLQLSAWSAFCVVLTAPSGLAGMLAVLLERGNERDDYIFLPDEKRDSI